MQLRMWMVDLAREQAPLYEHLRMYGDLTRAAGYNALGLYLEHRYAYPSTPWAHGKGAVTPDMVAQLQEEYPDLQIIPFINLLGHFEGMLGSEGGKVFSEEPFVSRGMQACPSKPGFVELASRMVDDVLAAFKSEIIHIGGDETWQLGKCPVCAARVQEYEASGAPDGKARLYGDHFGPLAQKVIDAGRRPAIWGDMFVDHPSALQVVPKETLIFDWQYFKSPRFSAQPFVDAGFEIVLSPALHTYNSTWLHLPQSEKNVRDHVEAAQAMGAHGVCVTTWECGLFGNYETMFPAIRAAGQMLGEDGDSEPKGPEGEDPSHAQAIDRYRQVTEAPEFLRAYLRESERHEEWARLMGVELQEAGGLFRFGGIRSGLKVRFMLYSNPFLLWLRHREDLCGEVGDRALGVLERAIAVAPDAGYRGVSEFAKIAINFVRYTDEAAKAYADGRPGDAVKALSPIRGDLDDLTRIARATNLRIGGSLADIERPRIAKEHVERVIRRIKEYGDGSLGYLPSFETITHPKFVPHDQANWWLVNAWANG